MAQVRFRRAGTKGSPEAHSHLSSPLSHRLSPATRSHWLSFPTSPSEAPSCLHPLHRRDPEHTLQTRPLASFLPGRPSPLDLERAWLPTTLGPSPDHHKSDPSTPAPVGAPSRTETLCPAFNIWTHTLRTMGHTLPPKRACCPSPPGPLTGWRSRICKQPTAAKLQQEFATRVTMHKQRKSTVFVSLGECRVLQTTNYFKNIWSILLFHPSNSEGQEASCLLSEGRGPGPAEL